MKIRSLAALLLAAILLLGGCTPPIGPDDGTIPPVSDTVGESGTDTAAAAGDNTYVCHTKISLLNIPNDPSHRRAAY